MHHYVKPRLERRVRLERVTPRPVMRSRTIIARSPVPVRRRDHEPDAALSLPFEQQLPDPYVDYGRFLTPEGGILIVYKDLDLRLRHILWAAFAWTTSTGLEGWFLLGHSPVHNIWINIGLLLIMAIINGFIVSKPVEIYRRIEIRPDCMIIEGEDIFWARYMENGWPMLKPDDEGNQVLCGVYGTRFVEYLTVRRFDELDRMPEVFAAHLQDGMMQLWTVASLK